MSEIIMYVLLLGVIPIGPYVLSRSKLVAFAFASVSGVVVLMARMVYLEVIAADSDLDIVFYFGLVVWSAILVLIYGIYYLALFLIYKLIRK
jgi:hypothetical protein